MYLDFSEILIWLKIEVSSDENTNELHRCVNAISNAENVIQANYFLKYGFLENNADSAILKGVCLQNTNKAEKPHTISVSLKKVQNRNVISKAHCTCKGGAAGKCKHCTALLILLSRVPDEKLIDNWGPTDDTCAWSTAKRVAADISEALPLEQFCHFKSPKLEKYPKLPPESNICYKIIWNAVSGEKENCAFSAHYHGRNTKENFNRWTTSQNTFTDFELQHLFLHKGILCDEESEAATLQKLNDCCDESITFYRDHVEVEVEKAKQIYTNTKGQSFNAKWKIERKIRITASRAYGLFTYSANKNPDWATKIEKFVFDSFKGNKATRYGSQVERRTLKLYAQKNVGEVITETGLFINPNLPFLGFSPDGFHILDSNISLLEVKSPVILKQRKKKRVIKDPCLKKSKVTVIKSPSPKKCKKNVSKNPKKRKEAVTKEEINLIANNLINSEIIEEISLVKVVNYLEMVNGKLTLKKRHKFYGQMQLSMALSGIQTGRLIITRGKRYITVVDVPFDPEFCENFLLILRNVYFERILPFLAEHKSKK